MHEFRTRAVVSGYQVGIVLFGLGICGCDRSEKIEVYSVPKHETLQTTAYLEDFARRHPKPVPRRIIGVMIPVDKTFWFLKLDGDAVAVGARENDVREFLKTLNLSDPAAITWTLPSGWQQIPPSELRYATLVLPGQPRLELSISKLPVQPDIELIDQLLANVNRWRNQISMGPTDEAGLVRDTEKIPMGTSLAYFVNLLGSAVPKVGPLPQGHPLVGGAERPAHPGAKEEAAEIAEPKYEKPANWEQAPPTMFARVSLRVTEGDNKVDITVTPARGNTLENVNRWRGQLKLEPIDAAKLSESALKVAVGSLTGDLYELSNDEKTILGIIVQDAEQTWFVKLVGNKALAEREKPKFLEFLKSLRFE